MLVGILRRAMFSRHGFSAVEELNADATDHIFILTRR